MDKLFGIDVSKKAEVDDDLEIEKETTAHKAYASPMQEDVEAVSEYEDEIEVTESDFVQSKDLSEKDKKQKPKSVTGMDVDYDNLESHDSKEIL